MIGTVTIIQPRARPRSGAAEKVGAIHSSGQPGNAGFYRRPAFAMGVRCSFLPW